MATTEGSNRDQLNQLLLNMHEMKWPGLDKKALISAVVTTLKQDEGARELLQSEVNADAIEFSDLVWNRGNSAVRALMVTKSSNWFVTLARNETLIPIMQAALDKFQSSVAKGNPEGRNDYAEIAAKVAEWRVHVENAKDDPFYDPQPTPGMIRAVEKFDAKQDNEQTESHNPNESAVTYPFILGKIIAVSNIDMNLNTQMIVKIVYDMLHFTALHGQKTVKAFTTRIAELETIIGPSSNVNLKPLLHAMVTSEEFHTSSGADASNKHVPNHKITLKRMVRIVYICTRFKTVWGLMNNQQGFTDNLKKLHDIEVQLENPDINSLAMVWYLAIERGNICAIMVDHWEKSASNALAKLLGRDEQETLQMPDHVFPLNKKLNEDFL